MEIAKTPVDIKTLIITSDINIYDKNKLIEKLQQHFSHEEQQSYVCNLFLYLNYHPTNDFIINLDNIWKFIGFSNKANAKRLLKHNFKENDHYKIVFIRSDENLELGGRPNETIMLNINTFKKLCLKANTEKADQIHDYYIKLEMVYNELMKEEMEEKQKEVDMQKVLLEEKDRTIQILKHEESLYLYLGYNPVIKELHKIGITTEIMLREEQHKTSNPNFVYLFTFQTNNAREIENLLKLLLRPYKVNKPEWFKIKYDDLKSIVDFCIMMYDEYKVSDSVENLIEFINKYKGNRLTTANRARTVLNSEIYDKYITENIIYGENLKVTRQQICEDFVEWYSISEYKDDYKMNEMLRNAKMPNNNWSHGFLKEITYEISKRTNKNPEKIYLCDSKRGYFFDGYCGFNGFELKSMTQNNNLFFKTEVYKKYVEENIEITNFPKHKLMRVEIIDDFCKWIKKYNYKEHKPLYTDTQLSFTFRNELLRNIVEITCIEFKANLSKNGYKGGFVGLRHKEFCK